MATPEVVPYSDAWLEGYTKKRYLEFLAVEDLRQRHIDLLQNVLGFDLDGTPHLRDLKADTGLTRRIADVWAESVLRSLGPQWLNAGEETVLHGPYPNVKRAIEAWGDRPFTPERCLVKYGRREHLIDLVKRGRVRLTPASEYAASPNRAIQDSELEFSVFCPPRTRLRWEMERGSGVYQDLPITGLITFTRSCEDYYVFCASAIFDPRAFDDFGYDACVLIHDFEKFVDRVKVQPAPARKLSAGATVYVDPFMPHRQLATVELMKHFRYGHQREWRICWTDPLPPPPLKPLFLELGDLSSFCEVITL